MDYEPELVLIVNEIYHDVEGREYESKHPEIFRDEVVRWRRIGKRFISKNFENLQLLDIGSGTGFIPLQVCQFLKSRDLFVCSDISNEMLKVCQDNLSRHQFENDFEYIKLDGYRINLEADSLDFILLNSVLHHIPDFHSFFMEINRLLKVGGYLIIGHEPNNSFYRHKLLWNNYQFLLNTVRSYRSAVAKIRRAFKHNLPPIDLQGEIIANVNQRLIVEGHIKVPLTSEQISKLVDIHAAGKDRLHRGMSVTEILQNYLPNFEINYLETYAHLLKLSSNRFLKWYDLLLRNLYPQAGAIFLVAFRKIDEH